MVTLMMYLAKYVQMDIADFVEKIIMVIITNTNRSLDIKEENCALK